MFTRPGISPEPAVSPVFRPTSVFVFADYNMKCVRNKCIQFLYDQFGVSRIKTFLRVHLTCFLWHTQVHVSCHLYQGWAHHIKVLQLKTHPRGTREKGVDILQVLRNIAFTY
jgi:hypothetical protein